MIAIVIRFSSNWCRQRLCNSEVVGLNLASKEAL